MFQAVQSQVSQIFIIECVSLAIPDVMNAQVPRNLIVNHSHNALRVSSSMKPAIVNKWNASREPTSTQLSPISQQFSHQANIHRLNIRSFYNNYLVIQAFYNLSIQIRSQSPLQSQLALKIAHKEHSKTQNSAFVNNVEIHRV